MDIKSLVDQVKSASDEIKRTQAKLEDEVKSQGKATEETKSGLETAKSTMEELKSKFDKLDEMLIKMQQEQKHLDRFNSNLKKSLGEAFLSGVDFKGLERNKHASVRLERKDISNLSTSAGALVRPDRDMEVYRDPQRPNRIRDLIPAIPTESTSVEVMRQVLVDNNAGIQTNPENSTGEFGTKPKSNYTWEMVSYPVRTVAHWVPASRQVLSDAPMLRGLIDSELIYGLDVVIDEQILYGDGTGNNLTGVMVDDDVQDVGAIAAGTDASDRAQAMIDHIRSAVTLAQKSNYIPDGVVLSPDDWETIETATDAEGRYLLFPFPATGSEERIWRMPVVVSSAMEVGDFVIGDWKVGAKIYEREEVDVEVSESHADFFVKNAVAIRAEERLTLGVNRPRAFVKGNFTIATND